MKAAFLTLGCKVNGYETEAVAELFKVRGFELARPGETADVVVVNTCTVTNIGDSKSRQTIRGAVRDHPGAAVVVMGCYSQLQQEKVAAIEGVSVVLGTKDRHLAPLYVEEYLKTKTPIVRVSPLSVGDGFEGMTIRRFDRHRRAFLKIEDGCDNFCSYCVIPYARGRVRSKDPATVLDEARRLCENGYHEIVLTGIHTGGYGKDLDGYRFADLLDDLAKIEGIERIRISSIEESELTEEVVDAIASNPLFANHLHIPLQSGSDKILRAMNRRYLTADYARKIASLRARIPGLSVTTDVIAGFPGETEEDFENSLSFIKRIGFSELHVFPFSRRDGTAAAKLPDDVGAIEKKRRVQRLLDLSDEMAKAFVRSQVGTCMVAIPEGSADGWLTGHTGNYLRVRFPGDPSRIGKPVAVRLTGEAYPISPAVMDDPTPA
ncbi:MAG: tRNA (N(6)-L-threonylcarbamoyladenosine(37)-C(2))-methylthiotransferase MtaB [Candidatus Izemoplasmatales bacterium]